MCEGFSVAGLTDSDEKGWIISNKLTHGAGLQFRPDFLLV